MAMTPEEIARDQAIVDAFNASQHAPHDEGYYDRVLGLARNENGEVVAVILTHPEENGDVRLITRTRAEIDTELRHGENARTAPGFYDIGMKRDGFSNREIVDIHWDNKRILERADRQMSAADPNALPSLEEAQARFAAPDFQPPVVDSDFVELPDIGETQQYRGLIGFARNEDGEAVALMETRLGAGGDPHLMALTEQEVAQQIDNHESVIYSGGMSDSAMLRQYRDAGFGIDSEQRVVDAHRRNRELLQGTLEDMQETMASGSSLPSVQDAARDYQQAQTTSNIPAPGATAADTRPVVAPSAGM